MSEPRASTFNQGFINVPQWIRVMSMGMSSFDVFWLVSTGTCFPFLGQGKGMRIVSNAVLIFVVVALGRGWLVGWNIALSLVEYVLYPAECVFCYTNYRFDDIQTTSSVIQTTSFVIPTSFSIIQTTSSVVQTTSSILHTSSSVMQTT